MSDWDVAKTMLEGRQDERSEALSFQNVCKCQCMRAPPPPSSSDGYEGRLYTKYVFNLTQFILRYDCKSQAFGLHWCYVSAEAAQHCVHKEVGVSFDVNICKFFPGLVPTTF